MARPLPEHPDLLRIDTEFLGHEGHVAAYLFTGEEPALLDPGASTGVDRVLRALDEAEVPRESVRHILLTHMHLDHAGAAGYLGRVCPRATVLAHPMTVKFLSDPERTRRLTESAHAALGEMAEGYGDLEPLPRERFEVVQAGDVLSVGGRKLRVLEAHGHAPHQVCYFDEEDRLLFTADEVGLWIDGESYPVTPPPNFDFQRTLESLERFEELQPELLLFPHFGPREDAVEGIREYASVLTGWVDEIRRQLREQKDPDHVLSSMLERSLPDYVGKWGEQYARSTIQTDVRGVLGYLQSEP